MEIRCEINQKEYVFEADECERVVDVLRTLGLTSPKKGCGEGECGACSVFFNSKLVNSCLLLAPQMQGSKIVTLEGLLEQTALIRENFEECGAVQCGFCTSGFVMRGYDYILQNGAKDEESLKEALDGNLCRCTGYQKIVEAILKSMR
ncbi:MAG: 2Fe-2S iron-sulfur cluster binding domain-containing protein [Campylobacterales bacterium]|nr:2Fe-2S iron-sulfur cluster binding domain-containing protein [Campylobacterales bacterium]